MLVKKYKSIGPSAEVPDCWPMQVPAACLLSCKCPYQLMAAIQTHRSVHSFVSEQASLFDPTDLTEDLTPAACRKALAAGAYVRAALIALRLGDQQLLAQCIFTTPQSQDPARNKQQLLAWSRATCTKIWGSAAIAGPEHLHPTLSADNPLILPRWTPFPMHIMMQMGSKLQLLANCMFICSPHPGVAICHDASLHAGAYLSRYRSAHV
eukprot:scaffold108795_cov23-Tisochrysis_lutea.AAC.1